MQSAEPAVSSYAIWALTWEARPPLVEKVPCINLVKETGRSKGL